MEDRLQEIIDHHDIRQTLARYCRGCDRCDEVEMASVYADGSWDDHGHRSGEGRQFSHAAVQELLETTKVVSHLLGQSLIWVHGDVAEAETYFHATMVVPPVDGVELVNHIAGRYVDKLVRDQGEWRIKDRLTIRDWPITHRLEQDPLAHNGITEGRQGPQDPSYPALGQGFRGAIFGRLAS